MSVETNPREPSSCAHDQLADSSIVHSPPTSRRNTFPQLGQRRSVASRTGSPGALIADSTRASQFGQASCSLLFAAVLMSPKRNTGNRSGVSRGAAHQDE